MQEAQIASLMQALALADATVAESITKASPRSLESPGSQRGTDLLDATGVPAADAQQGAVTPSAGDALPRQLLPELMSTGAATPAATAAWTAACQSYPLAEDAAAHDTPASAAASEVTAAVAASSDPGTELGPHPVGSAGAPVPGHVARTIALLQLHSARARQQEGTQVDAGSTLLPGFGSTNSNESSSPVMSSFGPGGYQFTSCPGGFGNDASSEGQGTCVDQTASSDTSSLLAGGSWTSRTISDAGAPYRFIAPPAARAFVKTPVPQLSLAAVCSTGSPDDAQAARDQQPTVQQQSTVPAGTPRLPPRPVASGISASNPFSATAKAPSTAAKKSAGGLLPFAGRAALLASSLARAPSSTTAASTGLSQPTASAPAASSVREEAVPAHNAIVLYTGPAPVPEAASTAGASATAPPASNLRKSVTMLLEGYSELDKALVSTLDSSKGVASALWRVAMGMVGLTTNFMLWSPATQVPR
jgi:hypothetical protein